ncbi:MAG TPA: RnfABCDGE type electron transport complex subunit D [Opitutaceae bacterium]|jgi:Na+-translocating ferredoxin:NAD+ oxidoreductase RnfD subunit
MSEATTETSAPVANQRGLGWFFSLDNRYLAPILITSILLAGEFSFGVLESWSKLLLAIGTSIAAEVILSRLVVGKWPHLASAYISGISVGILIRSPLFWPYALCAALSIFSKYLLRWRGHHLWNPSNFGVSAMLFLYPAAVASLSIQWGNSLWPMLVVWTLGSLILARLRRFHICLSYVGTFVALSGVRSLITGTPWLADVAPLTGPMYQLFVFFMITDPKTTVRSKKGQCLVAVLIAVVEAGMRLDSVVDAPYYALFLVGPISNIVDMLRVRNAPAPIKAA